jgi:hypothetical protein
VFPAAERVERVGAVDLAECDAATRITGAERLEQGELGLRPHATDKDYVARLHTALGIGAAGDGNKKSSEAWAAETQLPAVGSRRGR